MRTPPSSGSSSRKSSHRRSVDYLEDCQDADGETFPYVAYGGGGGGMLPFFLRDQSELVEVTLELDEESMTVRSVMPASGIGGAMQDASWGKNPRLNRSSSMASCIRRQFGLLRSPSMQRSSSSSPSITPAAAPSISAREARRIRMHLDRTRSGAQRALRGLRFISRSTGGMADDAAELWRVVEKRFDTLAVDGFLARDDFGECIGMGDSSKEFARGLFDALVRRRRQILERITKEELHEFWLQISDQCFDARLQIFFDMVDANADGRITRDEVQELIELSASANKLSRLREQADEYAALIMEELDPENFGYIELWQLEALLLQRDSYMNYSRTLSTASAAGWSQNIVCGGGGRGGGCGAGGGGGGLSRRVSGGLDRSWKRVRVAVREGWRRAWVVALWVVTMAALFAWKFAEYWQRPEFEVMGFCLLTAKGAAETLKLNMALVLLPVCRNTLTWLRSTGARLFVPFDESISFHKVIAVAIVVGIVLHAVNHLACDFPRLIRASPADYGYFLADNFGQEKPSYGKLISGVEGVTGIAMVVLMVVSFTLATHWFRMKVVRLPYSMNRFIGFNAFWYSHHLLAVVYALLLVHGYFLFLVHKWYQKTTWMYIFIPMLLYTSERILRTFRSKAFSVKILKVSLLPGNVLTLMMSKPHGFGYKSGQYIFLKCPAISPFEWHPFSITSAPGDAYLDVYIRANGDWTQELKRIFAEKCLYPSSGQQSLPKLLVDGPYGAPAQDFRNYDVLMLVGLGIGATPFISILRDLLNGIKLMDELMESTTETSRSDDSMNSVNNSTSSSSKKMPYRTNTAHFYWVTRESSSFEWFKGVMNEVAEMDKKGVIELHNYLTSVYEEGDARSTLLAMVQALNHAKHGVDIISGTRVRTHFARPSWKEVFRQIAAKHKGATVGVFYCGTPVLAKELRKLSREMSQMTSTQFHFHKEYF